ncbi:Nuclear pore complex protein Nup93-1 [Eumeta japonica]|uniref:Nuclear pore protein n=1 Tax=Eumeta variegata TaxID=151549 RepID=A0A4C1SV35_EUMVA|nr:Nuclear pore complex protein Nup93-1 [Eumeta japonica]
MQPRLELGFFCTESIRDSRCSTATVKPAAKYLYIYKLLQQAEQLTTEIEGNEELPRVERSLGQVLEASQELYSKVTQSGANDIQAHLLFGSKGIDLQQISQKLETLSSKRTFEPLQPIADSDVESFLKNEKENAILSLIDEVNKNSLQTTEDQKWEHMLSDWNREKIKLMNAMIGPSQNWLDLKKIPEPMAIGDASKTFGQSMLDNLETTKRTPEHLVADTPKKFGLSMLDNVEAAYARQVLQYNKSVFQGTKSRTALYQKFAQVADDFNDLKAKEMWEVIKMMSNIPAFARDEDPLKARGNPAIQQCLIAQGKKYLENRYKQYMSDVVRTNPAAAMRGGEPGTYPLVRSFVGLRLQGQGLQGLVDGIIDDRPLWPMVYYCLRSGDANAALYCLKKAGRDHEEFVQALEEYIVNPEKPLGDQLQTAINFQYRIQVRNATDPYKRAVYCAIGCCDVSDEHTEVARTADDYLWLKLCTIKPRANSDTETYTYSDLQKMILEEYGETHYHAYEKPLVYFQVLTLTGQFEPAIEFLSRIPRYQVHGVHMALALHDVYLLGTPRNVQAPLLSVDTDDPSPLRRLNLARLLLLYVRKFELTDPTEALHYFFFLRNLKDPDGKNLFMCCCTELALESRDYEALFGRIDAATGLRSTGLLDQFNNPHIDTKVIALNVAEQLVNKGMFEDAITMYDIAGNLEKALELFCVLLSQVVSGGGGVTALRQRLAMQAQHVSRRLRCDPTPLPAALLDAYNKLCKLMTFFDHYHEQNYDLALESLRECELVPLSTSELEARVAGARAARGELLRCLPAVLRALATILTAKRQQLKVTNAPLATQPQNKQIEWLRDQAEVLNTFAGNISYRMPGDTYSQLAQMQILMH